MIHIILDRLNIFDLPVDTVGSRDDISVVDESGTAVESAFVEKAGHPWVVVGFGWTSADDPVLVFSRDATSWRGANSERNARKETINVLTNCLIFRRKIVQSKLTTFARFLAVTPAIGIKL